MWKHVKKSHPEKLSVGSLGSLGPDVSDEDITYSNQGFKDLLVEWVVESDQPFSEVEHRIFRQFVKMLYPDAVIPSADTVKREMMTRFDNEKVMMQNILIGSPGRISFGLDVWTSPNMYSFLGITAHWIDEGWNIRSILLNLQPLDGPHNGENLCNAFVSTCHQFGILDKFLALTTDSASNNNTMAARLRANFRKGLS